MSNLSYPSANHFVKTSVSSIHDARLSDRAFRLLLLLKETAWRDGTTAPGDAELAAALRCSVRSVQRALCELEAAGYLSRRRGGNGENATIAVPECAPAPVRPDRKRTSARASDRTAVSPPPPAPIELDAQDATASLAPAPLPPAPDPAEDSAAAALTEKGMDPYLARKAVRLYGVDRCQKALYRLSREPSVRAPGRWLWCALSRGYDLEAPPPAGASGGRSSAAAPKRPPLTGYTVTDDKGRPVFVVTEPRRGPRSAPSSPSGG